MINKFQQGGRQQDAIMQFVQGLAETLQADPNQIVEIAQQNPEALKSAVQVYQETQDMNKAAQAFQQVLQAKTRAMNEAVWLNNQRKIDTNLKPQTEKVPDSNTVAEAIGILNDVVKITKNGKAVFKG